MNEIDLTRTKNSKWLFIKENPFIIIVELLFRIIVRGLLIFVLGAFFLAYFVSAGANSDWMFFTLIGVCLLAGVFETMRDFWPYIIQPSNLENLSGGLKEYFELRGWWVRNNNKQYFYATKQMGKAENHFYMVYKNGKAYIYPVYELPFPFSAFLSNKDIQNAKSINQY
ncbi:MAG: hypothetical protein K6L76_13110 [Agarilytica sp.]